MPLRKYIGGEAERLVIHRVNLQSDYEYRQTPQAETHSKDADGAYKIDDLLRERWMKYCIATGGCEACQVRLSMSQPLPNYGSRRWIVAAGCMPALRDVEIYFARCGQVQEFRGQGTQSRKTRTPFYHIGGNKADTDEGGTWGEIFALASTIATRHPAPE